MKVLFGINNDDTVKGISNVYEQKFKEKIEYKNVYYFKQFIQELQTGGYDRAVLLEELEKYPTNNYAQIDEYLFDNIDHITDVYDAKNLVYIASDRRRLGDDFLSKLFNLGIYTVLTGQERTKGKVCERINEPFTKRDVKKFYEDKLNESVYKSVQVSEIEIQRIVSYYKNLNGVADKYNEIFDRVSTQYTGEQLKIIIRFLPPDVKQYLSFNNDKYKQIINAPDVVASQNAQQIASNKEVFDKTVRNDVIEIKKEPEIIERIVVKEVNKEAPVVTEILEKEVYQTSYEVPKDYRKVVCFIGAPKSGTTFCINAIATHLARNKVKTAVVDLTKKRDTYTIYTYDNEGKRSIAAESLKYASNGMNEPLMYDKLSIYTGVPGEDRKAYNAGKIIDTVMQYNNAILIDSDFTTPTDYYRLCQEIYVVQDMDILNINQITLFLRDLKNKGVPMSKIRVIINKHVKCALTAKDILDGIATYTSYDLKMYDELFTSGNIPYFILPFNEENYKKYIEMVFKYSNLFATFTDDFKEALNKIINSIYPVGNVTTATGPNVHKSTKKSSMKGFFRSKKVDESYFSPEQESGFEKEIK